TRRHCDGSCLIASPADGTGQVSRAIDRQPSSLVDMVSVLCMDLEPETLAQLQRHRRPPILHEASSSAHLIATLEHDPTATEAEALSNSIEEAAKRTQKRRILRAMNTASVARLDEDAVIESPTTAPFLVRLLDNSPVGIVVLNPHGRVQFGNPSAVDLLALPE